MRRIETDNHRRRLNRPKTFEYFDRPGGAKDGESRGRKYWKIFTYVIMVFLFVISLTGCIQPFFIPSSKKVGSGFELYTSKQVISPHVTTIRYSATDKQFMLTADSLSDQDNNIYLGSSQATQEMRNINERLREQAVRDGGNFEAQGIVRSAVRLIDDQESESQVVYASNDTGERRYLSFVSNQTTYNPASRFTDISLYDIAGIFSPDAKPDEPLSKYTLTGVHRLSADKQFDSLNTYYARDIIQVLFNRTLIHLHKEYGDIMDSALEAVRSAKKGDVIKLTWPQRTVLYYYNRAVAHYLSAFHFRISNFANDNTDADIVYTKFSDQGISNSLTVPLHADAPGPQVPSEASTTWGEVWEYGPFYALFVWPLFLIVDNISGLSNNWSGWGVVLAIIIVVLVTKLLQFLLTFKTIFSQYKLEEIRPKRARIEAKYEIYKDNKLMMQKKQQELAELFRKHNFKPLSVFVPLIITTPVLISVWRVFTASPEVKSTVIAGISFSETSYSRLFAGEWQYLFIILIALVTQLVAQLLPRFLQRKKRQVINVYERQALRKQEKTQRMMMVFFIVLSVFFQAGVQFYWTLTGLWTIGQNLFIHRFQRTEFFKLRIKPRL